MANCPSYFLLEVGSGTNGQTSSQDVAFTCQSGSQCRNVQFLSWTRMHRRLASKSNPVPGELLLLGHSRGVDNFLGLRGGGGGANEVKTKELQFRSRRKVQAGHA